MPDGQAPVDAMIRDLIEYGFAHTNVMVFAISAKQYLEKQGYEMELKRQEGKDGRVYWGVYVKKIPPNLLLSNVDYYNEGMMF